MSCIKQCATQQPVMWVWNNCVGAARFSEAMKGTFEAEAEALKSQKSTEPGSGHRGAEKVTPLGDVSAFLSLQERAALNTRSVTVTD